MPRPADSPAPSSASSSPAASPDGGFLCERLQQLRQRVRSRCLAADAAEAGAIPCLLQSWRKRIEAMDDAPQMHRHHRGHRHFGHHHRRPCHAAAEDSDESSSSSSSSSSSPPPACGAFPFRGPRLLHPRLERQQAVCSLSGLWGGFASPSQSPPPSPEIYAKPRHRRHPYTRCFGRGDESDDRRKSSE